MDGDRAAGESASKDAGDHRADQEGRGALAGESAQLLDQIAWLPVFQPTGRPVCAIGGLADQIAGHPAGLAGPGHRVKLLGQ